MTFDEWMNEVEVFSLRRERATESEIAWANAAWNVQQLEIDSLKKELEKINKFYEVKSKSHAERLADLSKANVENLLLKEEIERLKGMLKQLTPEKFPGVMFIHAHLGEKDVNGMPEKLLMVPTYGSDVTYIYERKDRDA
jgi:hypothetical protein